MKRFLLLAITIMAAMPALKAQPAPENDWRDRVRCERIAFITSQLDLTPAEAEKFWPVYNEYKGQKAEAQKEIRETYRVLKEAMENGGDIETSLNNYVKALDAKAGTEAQALKAYKKVLPMEKIAKLYLSEEKFRMDQIHKLHRGPVGHHHNGPERHCR